MYQTRHTFASNALAAGEAPSWVAAMLGHASPEMLFSGLRAVHSHRTRRDGSALVNRMDGAGERGAERKEGRVILPKYSRARRGTPARSTAVPA